MPDSDTHLTQAEAKADLEQRGYRLVEPFASDDVTTEGWLSELMDRWSRLAVRPPTKRVRTESSNAGRFCESPRVYVGVFGSVQC